MYKVRICTKSAETRKNLTDHESLTGLEKISPTKKMWEQFCSHTHSVKLTIKKIPLIGELFVLFVLSNFNQGFHQKSMPRIGLIHSKKNK